MTKEHRKARQAMSNERRSFKNQVLPIIINIIVIATAMFTMSTFLSSKINAIDSNSIMGKENRQLVTKTIERLNDKDISEAELKKDIQYIKETVKEIKEALK